MEVERIKKKTHSDYEALVIISITGYVYYKIDVDVEK